MTPYVANGCEALGRIARGDNCIMVASARALLRCVPPVESRYWESTTFAVGEEIPFDEVPQRLVGMGYTNAGAADAPGLFRVHGDTVEVFPAQEKAPVRIEFFGDEIDRIRCMVSSTGQTIGNEDSIEIFPCRELALTDEAVHNMHVALYRASQDDSKLAALLEMVDARIVTPELDRFLPVMYGQTVSPLSHVSGKRSWCCPSRARCSTIACAPTRISRRVPARRGSTVWTACTCVPSNSTLAPSNA